MTIEQDHTNPPQHIIDFVDALYEGNGEEAMQMFSEEQIVEKATKTINEFNMMRAKGLEAGEEFYDRSVTSAGDAFMVTRTGKCSFLWVLIDSITSNLPLKKWAQDKTAEHFSKVKK